MSDAPPRRRIRAQASAADPAVTGFTLDAEIQPGRAARWEGPEEAPLARALFALDGVKRVEVRGATVWVRKAPDADWAALKPAIAAAIRRVLDETDAPLGAAEAAADDPDAALLRAVEELLARQVNPAVASHGGRIDVERVENGAVFLRMSGGCQGCAASAATLREGVERMLRAALPEIRRIVDVTDHAAGEAPFYAGGKGASPLLHRPLPEGVIGREGGRFTVDPDWLAPRLGLTAEALRAGLQSGAVVGVTETGEGEDAGRTRLVIRSASRAWAAEIDETGAAREIPPPRPAAAATGRETALAGRLRAHLRGLAPGAALPSYGALARALGLWWPGSVRRVTAALETTMREDAAAGRPFIAARAICRAGGGLPGKGFFDLARALGRGPAPGESEADFHARELERLEAALGPEPTEG
ncbi:iron-sulfur cluster biogenesis protein NfuA [Gemmobacter nectariphilus]|uniref:iron-sulfur cluster biogenesis protein NfuA n=1 Tax=Gemmobacter nectariphilus TaxID=220343 RepID=UPI000426F5B7|nr:iron-sulfur cluster biogenesis protein NfuA [Gemmobacter nectariphilus]